jgi:hypothetical protein
MYLGIGVAGRRSLVEPRTVYVEVISAWHRDQTFQNGTMQPLRQYVQDSESQPLCQVAIHYLGSSARLCTHCWPLANEMVDGRSILILWGVTT